MKSEELMALLSEKIEKETHTEGGADPVLAHVEIRTDDTTASITIDGMKVKGVVGYTIQHNAQETATPLLTLQIRCNLDITTQMVPLLPEPWSWFYEARKEYVYPPDPA